MVVNRTLPRTLFGSTTPSTAPPVGLSPKLAARLRRGYQDLRALAAHQEAVLAPLVATAGAPVVAEVPLFPADPGSLADLLKIGSHLFPGGAATGVPARGLGR